MPASVTQHLKHQVTRWDPDVPVAQATTPPSAWFADPAFDQLDRQHVCSTRSAVFPWQAVARTSQVAAAGAFATAHLPNGDPVVVVRGHDMQLRAFYNVCQHHAATVVTAPEGTFADGQCMTCPYHGWQYRMDGRLVKAPQVGGIENFRTKFHGLRPLHVDTFGPMVMVRTGDADDGTPGLDESLGIIKERMDAIRFSDVDWHFVKRAVYPINCNWKVFVDNYLDGGYHVPVLHKSLSAQLDLSTYRTEVFDVFSLQTVGGGDASANGQGSSVDFAQRLGDAAVYAYVYPNVMLNRYGPWLDTNLVVPTSPTSCNVVFDYYIDPGAVPDDQSLDAFVAASLAASHQVQVEDQDICESVQKGLASAGYDVGRYAPKLEFADHHFHQMLAKDYATALG